MKRGDIILIALKSGAANEQSGLRPAVIISNDLGNTFSPVVTVAPLTSKVKKQLPTHVTILSDESNGLLQDSTVLCEQVLTISKQRILKHIGTLTKSTMQEINKCLMESLELHNE